MTDQLTDSNSETLSAGSAEAAVSVDNTVSFGGRDGGGRRGSWLEAIGSFALAIGLALGVRWAFFEAYVIPSGSMLPTLLIHDHIFVNKIIYGVRLPFSKTWVSRFGEPKRGEVIVFKYPLDENIFFIKRIIGVPGDHIVYEEGELYVNGQKIDRKIAPSTWDYDWVREQDLMGGRSEHSHFQEVLSDNPHSILLRNNETHMRADVTVPPAKLFVMGDNRDHSNDSRYWGFVPIENVLGRATFVWLSCEETLPGVPFLCNPFTTRWGRLFHSIQ